MEKKEKSSRSEGAHQESDDEQAKAVDNSGVTGEAAREEETDSDNAPSPPTSDAATEVDPEDLEWILPASQKTRLHVSSGLVDDEGRPIPRCRTTPFAWGYEIGTGLSAAMATGRLWHCRCFDPDAQ